jgi:hypothetical protein
MLINSPNISGSLTVTGNAVITGSLTVAGGINATITGSATSASYVEYSNVANKPTLVSGSSQVSFNGITDKPTLVSGSSQVTYSGLSGIPSGIVSGSSQVSFNGITDKPTLVSGSEQVSFNGITDKPTLVSGSSQVTYSGLSGIPSGIVSSSAQVGGYNIFATTGSNQFNGSQAITGSLTVTGQVVAQTLNVQQVTSSIVYSSGSNIFGNTLGNTQQFTGSVSVTGSLTVTTNGTELQVTSNGVNLGNALTDSHIISGSLRVNPNGLFVSGSGNVGIGTVTPFNPLHIVSNTLSQLNIQASSGNTNAQINLEPTGTGIALIGPANNVDLAFRTNATTRMLISGSGNVGIGTTPLTTLDVNGTINIRTNGFQFGRITTNNVSGDTGGLTFQYNLAGTFTNGIVLNGAGNIGIGNDSPVTRLTLGGYTGSRLPYINGTGATFGTGGITVTSTNSGNAAIGGGLDLTNNTYSVNAYSPIISFSSRSSSGDYNNAYAGIYGVLRGPGGDSNWVVGDIVFATATSYGLTEKMRLITGGFLGIGTDSPEALLHLSQASTGGNGAFIFVDNPASSTLGNTAGIRFATNAGASFSGYGSSIEAVNTNAGDGAEALTFSTWNGASRGERMRITSGGNVGIGTTSPTDSRLQIKGANNTTNAYADGLKVTSNNETVFAQYSWAGINANDVMRFATAGTEKMRITSSGSVGVGVTPKDYASTWTAVQVGNFALMGPNPTADANAIIGANAYRATDSTWRRIIGGYANLIELNQGSGDIRTYTGGTSTADSTISFVNGPFVANGGVSWTNGSSDVRKKKNFEPSQGLAEVLQIEPVKYHFNWDKDNDKKRLGFKAQNILELIPEMVSETGELAEDGTSYLTLTPDYILPVLVKAIQEQQTQIEILKTKIEILEQS